MYFPLKEINHKTVYKIDGVPTIIDRIAVKNGYAYAKGFILKNDLTLKPCYVAKKDNTFAHGKTLKEAKEDLDRKLLEDTPVEEKIQMFLERFDTDKKYPAQEFYNWHGILTGSCTMGRDNFVEEHGIDLKKDKLTVKEFIMLTKNSYNGHIIKMLEDEMLDGDYNDD